MQAFPGVPPPQGLQNPRLQGEGLDRSPGMCALDACLLTLLLVKDGGTLAYLTLQWNETQG